MTDVKRRLTREESRAQTRQKIVDAAAEVFAERGFYGASVEEIAERAGFTRGAFYSNFKDKDDIFFAVYDQRMKMQVDEISTLLRDSNGPAAFFASLRGRPADTSAQFAWVLLRQEFLLYALRNPDVRSKFAERYRKVRRQLASAIEAIWDAMGLDLPAPVEDVALILNVLDEGILPLHFLDPETVREGFYFDALNQLVEAAVALAEKRRNQ